MLKSFTVTTEVRAETEEEALGMVMGRGLAMVNGNGLLFKACDRGFVHADGQVRRCEPAPSGFVVYQYDELAEEHTHTRRHYLALPMGTRLELSPEGRIIPPEGTLIWRWKTWQKLGHGVVITK